MSGRILHQGKEMREGFVDDRLKNIKHLVKEIAPDVIVQFVENLLVDLETIPTNKTGCQLLGIIHGSGRYLQENFYEWFETVMKRIYLIYLQLNGKVIRLVILKIIELVASQWKLDPSTSHYYKNIPEQIQSAILNFVQEAETDLFEYNKNSCAKKLDPRCKPVNYKSVSTYREKQDFSEVGTMNKKSTSAGVRHLRPTSFESDLEDELSSHFAKGIGEAVSLSMPVGHQEDGMNQSSLFSNETTTMKKYLTTYIQPVVRNSTDPNQGSDSRMWARNKMTLGHKISPSPSLSSFPKMTTIKENSSQEMNNLNLEENASATKNKYCTSKSSSDYFNTNSTDNVQKGNWQQKSNPIKTEASFCLAAEKEAKSCHIGPNTVESKELPVSKLISASKQFTGSSQHEAASNHIISKELSMCVGVVPAQSVANSTTLPFSEEIHKRFVSVDGKYVIQLQCESRDIVEDAYVALKGYFAIKASCNDYTQSHQMDINEKEKQSSIIPQNDEPNNMETKCALDVSRTDDPVYDSNKMVSQKSDSNFCHLQEVTELNEKSYSRREVSNDLENKKEIGKELDKKDFGIPELKAGSQYDDNVTISGKKPDTESLITIETKIIKQVNIEQVTNELVTIEPVAIEPVAIEPVTIEPVAIEPVAIEPIVTGEEENNVPSGSSENVKVIESMFKYHPIFSAIVTSTETHEPILLKQNSIEEGGLENLHTSNEKVGIDSYPVDIKVSRLEKATEKVPVLLEKEEVGEKKNFVEERLDELSTSCGEVAINSHPVDMMSKEVTEIVPLPLEKKEVVEEMNIAEDMPCVLPISQEEVVIHSNQLDNKTPGAGLAVDSVPLEKLEESGDKMSFKIEKMADSIIKCFLERCNSKAESKNFQVPIESQSSNPWCNILSNGRFGSFVIPPHHDQAPDEQVIPEYIPIVPEGNGSEKGNVVPIAHDFNLMRKEKVIPAALECSLLDRDRFVHTVPECNLLDKLNCVQFVPASNRLSKAKFVPDIPECNLVGEESRSAEAENQPMPEIEGTRSTYPTTEPVKANPRKKYSRQFLIDCSKSEVARYWPTCCDWKALCNIYPGVCLEVSWMVSAYRPIRKWPENTSNGSYKSNQ